MPSSSRSAPVAIPSASVDFAPLPGTADAGPPPARSTAELIAADRRHLWHPFTQQSRWCEDDAALVIERARGTTLYDTDGNAYIDGVSSLWCNVHGHRHPTIDAAIRAQLDRVAHSTMLGLSHPPAIELAERLTAIAPPGLTRVFYSDSGSTAVEVALKMAFQWWAQRGKRERCGFVCLENAYHGDTLGAVSVGGIETFHALYRPLLFETWGVRAGDLGQLDRLLTRRGEQVAAVIIEPLVQGAAGMLMQPDGYVRGVRELCDRHGVLLICDEVATGFGRTGTMFACQREGVTPDLLCVGKGLTGGYLPLAATLTSERVYEGFLDGGPADVPRTFFHGHTYTGNPLACAAALATLEVFERERTLEQVERNSALLSRLLERHVAVLDGVVEVRKRGLMVGIELRAAGGTPASVPATTWIPATTSGPATTSVPATRSVPDPTAAPTAPSASLSPPSAGPAPLGHRVVLAARRRGAVIRPLGDVVVLMPALAIAQTELTRLVEITAAAIAEVTEDRLAA